MPAAYTSFIFFFLLLAFGFGNAPILYDSDTAWHLAAGDLIRETHSIPLTDSWSFTSAGETWYNLSWLYDTLLSFVFSLGGFSAVYTLTAFVFALSVTLMARHCIYRGASLVSVFFLLIPVMVIVFTGTIARPNMCSILLTLVFYFTLHEFRDRNDFSRLVILAPLMCLWTNLHGGFLMAYPLIGIFMLEAALEDHSMKAKAYLQVAALCLIASLINPYGFSIYYGAYKTLTATFSNMLIEWQPAEIGHNTPVTALLLIVLVAGDFSDRKIPFSDRALSLLMLLLSLSSLRHSPLAALLLMPYLSLRITRLLYESPYGSRVRRLDQTIMGDMQEKGIRVTAALMSLVALVNIYTPFPRDALLDEPAGFRQHYFPIEEARLIEGRYSSFRFFNSYNIGGYLDYIWRGKVKTFVDGRANSLYSDQLLRDYTEFWETRGFGGRSDIIAHKYRLDGLIIENDAKDYYLWGWNPHWKMVYRGKAATVYLRSDLVKSP